MAAPRAGQMRAVVQFRRGTLTDDGIAEVNTWGDYGAPQRARKIDASAGEQWRASEVGAKISARFQVYRNEITQEISPKDRITCDGLEYDISGKIVMQDDERFFEISAATRADKP